MLEAGVHLEKSKMVLQGVEVLTLPHSPVTQRKQTLLKLFSLGFLQRKKTLLFSMLLMS
jgi:hypothetical protein